MIDGFYSEVDEHSGYKGGTLLQTIKLGLDSLLLKKKRLRQYHKYGCQHIHGQYNLVSKNNSRYLTTR